MVNDMRVPSSSSSSSGTSSVFRHHKSVPRGAPTDSDWLDPDTLFDVRALWIVRVFALQHPLSTQRVDEGGTACA